MGFWFKDYLLNQTQTKPRKPKPTLKTMERVTAEKKEILVSRFGIKSGRTYLYDLFSSANDLSVF